MLTAVERVLILKGADLLRGVGPRHLLGLANVSREVPMYAGDVIYLETDAADALYIVVEGRVRVSSRGRVLSEVGPGDAFGTWSLVDDSERGQLADCVEDGLALALSREDFYDVAAADLVILQELVRVLAKRLRELAADAPPEEARVEGEGVAKTEAQEEAQAQVDADETAGDDRTATPQTATRPAAAITAGASLAAAATGKEAVPEGVDEDLADLPLVERPASLDPVIAPAPIAPAVTKPEEPRTTGS